MRVLPSLPLVVLAITMMLPLAAHGDLSVVLDLDGDYENGPDNLTLEPNDTFFVDVWITGADSILAFGITIEDVSEALVWIEEPAESIYSTGPNWTNSGIVQAEGKILLQCTDFLLSNPINAPKNIAEIGFVFNPLDSCVSAVLDSANSGWWNQELGDRYFSSSTGIQLCTETFVSEMLRETQADEQAEPLELLKLYQREATTPSAAATVFQLIGRDIPDVAIRATRVDLLCMAIEPTLRDHASLLSFQAELPETSRPLRSYIIAGYLLARSGEISEGEFQELEQILVRDLCDYFGQTDALHLVEMIATVSKEYHRKMRYSSDEPNTIFSALSDRLCHAINQREYSCLTLLLRDQNHPELDQLFLEEVTGLGCLGSSDALASRGMLNHLLYSESGTELLANIVRNPRNDRTYLLALLVGSQNIALHGDTDLHNAVFETFEDRYGALNERDEFFYEARENIAGYVTAVWPQLRDAILQRPNSLYAHAALIAQNATKTEILDFAAENGMQWEEPYLSSFAERIVEKGTPDEVELFLLHVSSERLPPDLGRRAESKAYAEHTPIMKRGIVPRESTNSEDSPSNGKGR